MNLNLPFVKRSIIENIVTENVVLPQINASKVIECAFLQFCIFPGNCLKKEICYLEYFHGINDVYPEIKIHCAFFVYQMDSNPDHNCTENLFCRALTERDSFHSLHRGGCCVVVPLGLS